MRGEGRGGEGREGEGRKGEGRDGEKRDGVGGGRVAPKLKLAPPELFFWRRRWSERTNLECLRLQRTHNIINKANELCMLKVHSSSLTRVARSAQRKKRTFRHGIFNCTKSSGARHKGPQPEAGRAEVEAERWAGEGGGALSPPAKESGEWCKLP